MRFLIRLTVLALAAVGAKTLYDRLAPRRDELKQTATDLAARTASATREVAGKAGEATHDIAASVKENTKVVKESAVQQAGDIKGAAETARREATEVLSAPEPSELAPETSSGA